MSLRAFGLGLGLHLDFNLWHQRCHWHRLWRLPIVARKEVLLKDLLKIQRYSKGICFKLFVMILFINIYTYMVRKQVSK